jgi:hypothetical protein
MDMLALWDLSIPGDQKIVIPYEWVNGRSEPVLAGWGLELRQQRQLKALLIQLEGVDYEIAVGTLIFKKGASNIYYSKVNGNVALRPRCCIGPELSRQEYQDLSRARIAAGESAPPERAMFPAGKAEVLTYLERVEKKDGKERPLLKDSKSSERLDEILENRGRRQRATLHKTGGPQ